MRCPYCGCENTQVKDSPSDRGEPVDPPPPQLRGLRRALHRVRAGAAARDHRHQALGPAGAVRPRELSRSVEIALRKRPILPERIERLVWASCAARKHGRAGDAVLGDRRADHGGAQRSRPRRLRALSPRSIATSARPPTSTRCSARSPSVTRRRRPSTGRDGERAAAIGLQKMATPSCPSFARIKTEGHKSKRQSL